VPKIASSSGDIGKAAVTLAPKIDTKGAMQGIKLSAGSDRDVVPLVRINPEYPQRALSRGIEGWVTVQFTITETGSVADPIVVDAMPKGMCDEAALKDIDRWRYNPKVEDGKHIVRKGSQKMLRFQLEN
jgi:protein TonB